MVPTQFVPPEEKLEEEQEKIDAQRRAAFAALEKRLEILETHRPKAPPVVTMTSLLNLAIGLVYAIAEACGHDGSRRR